MTLTRFPASRTGLLTPRLTCFTLLFFSLLLGQNYSKSNSLSPFYLFGKNFLSPIPLLFFLDKNFLSPIPILQKYSKSHSFLDLEKFPLPCLPIAYSCHRSLNGGAVGPPRTKTNNTANVDFQPVPKTQEASSTTIQNLTSRICKFEKLFANEVSTYTSITAGVHSQYFLLYDKIRQLESGNSDVIIWKIPSVKFVFDSAKVARPSSDPLIEPATSFSSPIFRTHPHGYNFFIKLYPYGIGPATGKCASVLFALFPGDYDNLLQWPFTKTIHIGIRDQLDPMNTWVKTIRPDEDPAYKKPTMSTKTGIATILINNFIPHSKLFSETEGFIIDGASFVEIKFSDPPVLKPHTQTSLLFPFP